jgi:inner membrane protein
VKLLAAVASSPIALLAAPAALLAIWLLDRWLGSGTHALLPNGVADETAHLLTMALILGVFPWPLAPRLVAGALAGAVLIDLDHLPLVLGSEVLTSETNRPFTHGLLVIAGLAGAAGLLPSRWRPFVIGLALGLAAHFFRDMATSTAGVPLFWPLSRTGHRISYAAYSGLLICCAAVLIWKLYRRGVEPVPSRRERGA